jgi:hypothetical protein
MPIDLDKFFLEFFPGVRWACHLSLIVISSDLNGEAGSVDKFLKWN